MKDTMLWALLGVTLLIVAACSHETSVTNPPTRPGTRATLAQQGESELEGRGFARRIDNPFLPLTPGTVFLYEGEQDGFPQVDRVYVTDVTKTIQGVVCTEVHDSVFVNDRIEEATLDWYAQDEEGNVWYFGEDTKEFDDQGNVTSTEGSWLAGVDGARAGIVMEGDAEVGDQYYQEFLKDVAEDQAQVMAVNASVHVPFGRFKECVKTREWTRLDPGIVEHKLYARGVGFLRAVTLQGGADHSELVSVNGVQVSPEADDAD